MIDLKTLYEQVTMYATFIKVYKAGIYTIEVFNQPETPIKIVVYWDREYKTINTISITNN